MEEKKKPRTSSAVKRRYNDKTYKRVTLFLRKVEDEDVINYLKTIKDRDGISPSQFMKDLVRKEMDK